MASQRCPNCGMERGEWQGNNGQGYEMEGILYCCRGCAEGTGCTCAGMRGEPRRTGVS